MKSFVLDASIALAWAFEDEHGSQTERILQSLVTSTAIVPGLWIYEVANGLIAGERRGRLDQPESAQFVTLLQRLPIKVYEMTLANALPVVNMARDHHLSAYDAAYLAVAYKAGLPLATLDGQLQNAAKAVGVKLFP